MKFKTKPLVAMQTPLQTTTLIEASAGTGKTFTMASLYLRLLLQLGDRPFSRPLNVDEILVVTFTEASTQELKSRIRERIQLAKSQFMAYRENANMDIFLGTDNEFLVKSDELPAGAQYLRQLDLDFAIQQLQFAEQNMDLAAIYTIHGFCRRMLMQYAVNSGIHFNLELVKDEQPLLMQLVQQCWRENFYPQSLIVTQFIQQHLKSPQELFKQISSYLKGKTLNTNFPQPALLNQSLFDFLQQNIEQSAVETQAFLQSLKQRWQQAFPEISQLFLDEFAKGSKALSGSKISEKYYLSRCAKIEKWLNESLDFPPDELWKFTQSYIDSAVKKGQVFAQHEFFIWLDEQQEKQDILKAKMASLKDLLLYHCIKNINQRLVEYKQNHPEKAFDDLLRLLNNALKSEQGDELAALIRHQYPFAMIDEFQDTDETQYQIFSRIYVNQTDCGFMMIGDPKQAIYQFRGADIFTYLKAAEDAGKQRFTLEKNFRSTPELIESVNQLLDFQGAFLYDKIPFLPAKSGKKSPHFVLKDKVQPPLHFYVNPLESKEKGESQNKVSIDDMAECCADSILHWLQSAAENQAFLADDNLEYRETLQSDDIAVLVRSGTQGAKVQAALRRRGIASVYLSDRSNVFDTKIARELVLILQACLNPFSQRAILNAISTGIFALTAAEIQRVKQHEALLEHWVSRFERYHQIWQWQGVLPMLYQLLLDKGDNPDELSIPEKILRLPKGERRLTDLFHLAELLQQNAALNESEAALLRWFERQVQGADEAQDQAQVRLESEQKLVKIVTIHKSKGLQYGLVWLPFLGVSSSNPAKAIPFYHNEQGECFWDMQGAHQQEVEEENLAEDMRLLYVALTRAKYQLCLALPSHFGGQWNALHYVLSQGAIGTNKKLGNTPSQSPYDLVAKVRSDLGENLVAISPLTFNPEPEKLTQISPQLNLFAAEFQGKIEQNWGINSFTSLSRLHERQLYRQNPEQNINLVNDDARDYVDGSNMLAEPILTAKINDGFWANFPENRTPLDFPRGTKFGVQIHDWLEKQNFSQPINEQSIILMSERLGLDESWHAPLKQWLEQILHTPLLSAENSFCLADLSPSDCLKEMQFYLKFNRTFDVAKFNQALREFHPHFTKPYLFSQIQGMLRGFVDLICRHQGKYYLIDYKTNFLGESAAEYESDFLLNAMQQHYYDLQYLIYCVALHRYLTLRDPNYDYESQFGGVIYTFVRGMSAAQQGVFFDRPDLRLIQALERLFYANA